MIRAERRSVQELQRQKKALAQLSERACEIVLVRHGETQWNVEHRLQGQLQPGPPLNPQGVTQAEALARRVANQHIDALYSSDLARAIQTAELITSNHHKKLEIRRDADLRERFLGTLHGKTLTEARMHYPREYLGLRTPNEASHAAGIETIETMLNRVSKALERIAAAHPGQRVLVLAHGGVLHVAYRKAAHGNPPSQVSNCALNTLKIDATTTPALWVMLEWGDEGHLDVSGDSFGGGTVG